jgi:hypothetical protein
MTAHVRPRSVHGVFGVRRVCLRVEQAIVVPVITNLDLYNPAIFVWTVVAIV